MPHPHNHELLKQKRNWWNDNRINQRKLKAKNETGEPSATSNPNTLSTALTTKFCVSSAYSSRIIEDTLKNQENIRPEVEKVHLGFSITDPTYNCTLDGPTYFLHWWFNSNFLSCLINQYPYEIFVESMQYRIYWIMGVLKWLVGAFWLVGSIPLHAHKLLSEPNGGSVWQIITNPEGASNQKKWVKRYIYCR